MPSSGSGNRSTASLTLTPLVKSALSGLIDQIRQAIDRCLGSTDQKAVQFLFAGRGNAERRLTTRQYARFVQDWVASIGLDPAIVRYALTALHEDGVRTGNRRADQLLLDQSKIEI